MTDEGPFDLASITVGVGRDGAAALIDWQAGPPPRTDGHQVGLVRMSVPPPHRGERHDDGDEPILVLSGALDLILDENGPDERTVALRGGQGFIVPRGVWHRFVVREPATLVHVTPGPNNQHR